MDLLLALTQPFCSSERHCLPVFLQDAPEGRDHASICARWKHLEGTKQADPEARGLGSLSGSGLNWKLGSAGAKSGEGRIFGKIAWFLKLVSLTLS